MEAELTNLEADKKRSEYMLTTERDDALTKANNATIKLKKLKAEKSDMKRANLDQTDN